MVTTYIEPPPAYLGMAIGIPCVFVDTIIIAVFILGIVYPDRAVDSMPIFQSFLVVNSLSFGYFHLLKQIHCKLVIYTRSY